MEKDIFIEPGRAYSEIEREWKAWDNKVRPSVYVVGISGGVDSTCAAALAARIFSKNRVVGVSLPCDGQKDMEDVDKAFAFLGIRRLTMDIGDMFMYGMNAIENQGIEMTDVCRTNMPARIRMTMLYGVAQCLGGVVVNTCNRSESVLGNDTLFGDDCGSYGPIQALTKTEVKSLAAFLGAPRELVEKTPIDGLQPLSDEERMGIRYEDVDEYIRSQGAADFSITGQILGMFVKNRFKLEIVRVPGPKFEFMRDSIRAEYGI